MIFLILTNIFNNNCNICYYGVHSQICTSSYNYLYVNNGKNERYLYVYKFNFSLSIFDIYDIKICFLTFWYWSNYWIETFVYFCINYIHIYKIYISIKNQLNLLALIFNFILIIIFHLYRNVIIKILL